MAHYESVSWSVPLKIVSWTWRTRSVERSETRSFAIESAADFEHLSTTLNLNLSLVRT